MPPGLCRILHITGHHKAGFHSKAMYWGKLNISDHVKGVSLYLLPEWARVATCVRIEKALGVDRTVGIKV